MGVNLPRKGLSVCLSDIANCTDDEPKRLQIVVAQIQQALPGYKRDGSIVLSAVTSELLHAENSTTRAGGVLIQSEFIRTLTEKIQDAPEEVIEAFENIRRNSEGPSV
jgi:redox-regulated HSP33 family molecular chaperone